MRPANDYLRKPTGPRMGMWSWRYLNIWKTIKMINSQRVKAFYEKLPTILPPGAEFPDFELKDLNGTPHKMSDHFGKQHLVVTTGAIT
ncbi:MAG: hypothetical protein HOE85_13225 [Nitrospinaceae bacterium]|nr:hypothetical protein [Nitrospinaceae bacterium]